MMPCQLGVLAELAAKMEPKEATSVAGRGAALGRMLEDPKPMISSYLRSGRRWARWRPRWSPRRRRASPAAWSRCSRTQETDFPAVCARGGAGRAGGQDGAQGGNESRRPW